MQTTATQQQAVQRAQADEMVSTSASDRAYTDQQMTSAVQQSNSYTDSKFNQAENDISKLRSDMYGGVASALAIAGLPQATAGHMLLGAAVSDYQSQQGLAIGGSYTTGDDKWIIKGGITTNSRGQFGGVIGAGRQF